jgi:hypothetical protein
VTSWDRAGNISVVKVRTLGFVLVRRVLAALGLGPAPDVGDVEIAVLGHHYRCLPEEVTRPRSTPTDRTVLAWWMKLLPRIGGGRSW